MHVAKKGGEVRQRGEKNRERVHKKKGDGRLYIYLRRSRERNPNLEREIIKRIKKKKKKKKKKKRPEEALW